MTSGFLFSRIISGATELYRTSRSLSKKHNLKSRRTSKPPKSKYPTVSLRAIRHRNSTNLANGMCLTIVSTP
jgi:hypothetical protein